GSGGSTTVTGTDSQSDTSAAGGAEAGGGGAAPSTTSDGGSASGGAGSGGAGGGPRTSTAKCNEARTGDVPSAILCGESRSLFLAYSDCGCSGACEAQCIDNACAGHPGSSDCTACVQDETNGCGPQWDACAADQ